MRKNVIITYHMSKPGEVAETCITLPMSENVAKDVLENQELSQQVVGDGTSSGPLSVILNTLAELQGFKTANFCCAKEAEPF